MKPSQGAWVKTFFLLFTISALVWLVSFTSTSKLVDYSSNEDAVQNSKEYHKPITSPKPPVFEINEIKKRISVINREEEIHNEEKFGPINSDSLVIVVQVHNRSSYLTHLIASLRLSKGISNVFLVFSHDFYDEKLNDLIQTIDFCKYMQIFYPYSMQIYPNVFPGNDPNDCPADISKYKAIYKACNNALHPDSHGTYRKANEVQLKHHWWWKANRAFSLAALHKYDGLILFLEEDLYLVDDFIPALRLMQDEVQNSCSYCKILSLAENEEATNLDKADFNKSNKAKVHSRFSNMGLAFNRATWNQIVNCRNEFCRYDDYNWDFSVQHVFTTCMGKSAAMTLSAPRVIHLGTCGIHFHSKDCDPSSVVSKIQGRISTARDKLHPKKLTLSYNIDNGKIITGYGGWGDPRDHALCLGMTIK